MSRAALVWKRLAEPTLQRRSVAFVLVAFVLIWAVLLGYMYFKTQRAIAADPPLQKFGDALSSSLEQWSDPGQAAAALDTTARWVNIRRKEIGRLPGQFRFELLDRQGRRISSSTLAAGVALPVPSGVSTPLRIDGQPHVLYQRQGVRWQVRITEPVRSTEAFLAYNSPFIVEYLLLALPIVVLSVWLSLGSGLRPLKLFAHTISRRDPEDLGPIAFPARHRELKPVASAVDALLEKLRRRLDRERLFVQDAAHELRTPLAVVVTQAHVMAHAPNAQERGRAHQFLEQAIARASHLAQQLLVLATLDAHERPGPRAIDVAQAVRELMAQAAPQAMARGMDLSLEAPDNLMSTIDEPAFGSIVLNLMDNAIRYGRDMGCVVVTLESDDKGMSLHVQDDGPGIPEAERALVFERFYRCAGQDVSGSGLGLAIVRQATTRMGGRILLTEGLAGRGIGFLVSLPKGIS